MKINGILCLVLIAGIIGVSGCKSEDKALKQEAKTIADAMCKSIGVMNELKKTDPADSVTVNRLQQEYQIVQSELMGLYDEFRAKHEKTPPTEEFNNEFRKYLNESMLDCKNLSKEERETFEKGMKQ
jgi:hypothetical protein